MLPVDPGPIATTEYAAVAVAPVPTSVARTAYMFPTLSMRSPPKIDGVVPVSVIVLLGVAAPDAVDENSAITPAVEPVEKSSSAAYTLPLASTAMP